MSYLDRPRLHFSGRFQTTVSTINNTTKNYDISTFSDTNAEPEIGQGGWNPNGTAIWRLVNCTVQRVCYADGTIGTSAADDSLIGAALLGADDRVDAKLVDLDPQQQAVSEIWGFVVRLHSLATGEGVMGDYQVAAFADMWKRFANGPSMTDSVMSACYQSVLTNLRWSGAQHSRLLRELREASPTRLSIKCVVDGFVDDSGQSDFTYGRIVGTIGPAAEHEPAHMLAGRALRPFKGKPLYYAYAAIDKQRGVLALDLGNSLPTAGVGGPVATESFGELALALRRPGATPEYDTLGPIDAGDAMYEQTAGIQEFALSADQLEAAATAPLAVIEAKPHGKALLEENSIGGYVRADTHVFRLNPGETARVELIATRFGQPAAGQQLDLALNPALQNLSDSGDPLVNTPAEALQFPASVTTDARGRASFTLQAGNPGTPRGYLDGQVYAVGYSWHAAPADYRPNWWNFVSVRLWDAYTPSGPPTWQRDILPIFKQYANLYPVMRSIVDLGDYGSVVQHAGLLKLAFGLPAHDPNHMPITRDLSRDKRAMILAWLDNPSE